MVANVQQPLFLCTMRRVLATARRFSTFSFLSRGLLHTEAKDLEQSVWIFLPQDRRNNLSNLSISLELQTKFYAPIVFIMFPCSTRRFSLAQERRKFQDDNESKLGIEGIKHSSLSRPSVQLASRRPRSISKPLQGRLDGSRWLLVSVSRLEFFHRGRRCPHSGPVLFPCSIRSAGPT